MKTHEAGANAAQRQPAAAVGQQALVQAASYETADRLGAQQAGVDQSPRMLAQRRALDATFGGAIQRQGDGLQDEEPVLARAAQGGGCDGKYGDMEQDRNKPVTKLAEVVPDALYERRGHVDIQAPCITRGKPQNGSEPARHRPCQAASSTHQADGDSRRNIRL